MINNISNLKKYNKKKYNKMKDLHDKTDISIFENYFSLNYYFFFN